MAMGPAPDGENFPIPNHKNRVKIRVVGMTFTLIFRTCAIALDFRPAVVGVPFMEFAARRIFRTCRAR